MRKYKRKRPGGWPNKDKRMILAVRLVREEGKSQRQAARVLGVSEGTVRNDLKRWQANVNVVPLVRKSSAQNRPHGGEITHPDYAPRTTAEAMGIPPHPMTVREEWQARAVEVLNDWR